MKQDVFPARQGARKRRSQWLAFGIFKLLSYSIVLIPVSYTHLAISKVFERLLPYYYTDKEQEMINQNFPLCENISVDYAIMEKARCV